MEDLLSAPEVEERNKFPRLDAFVPIPIPTNREKEEEEEVNEDEPLPIQGKKLRAREGILERFEAPPPPPSPSSVPAPAPSLFLKYQKYIMLGLGFILTYLFFSVLREGTGLKSILSSSSKTIASELAPL
jgi:hypothetical protein